jgi:hypothetical protein
MFTNLINGKRYIGSAKDIRNRMYVYYSIKSLENCNSMLICRALLKHGYSNFSLPYLEILEYCEPDKCLEREYYYFKLLKPEYNTSLNPSAVFAGRKHSDESRKKISDAHQGENNPMFGKPKPLGAGSPAKVIEVFDLKENTKTYYNSISEAARALNINHTIIVKYFARNQQKPYKGRYTFQIL